MAGVMRFLPFLLVPSLALAAGGPATSAVTADAMFAADVLELRARGYRLADVGAEWSDGADESSTLTLSVVLSKGERAERFTVSFAEYGQEPWRYERKTVPAPAERRHYGMEDDFFAALRKPGPFMLSENCGGDFHLSGPESGVSVTPNDYYVVVARARGAAARERLASEISSAVGAGLDLAGMRGDGEGNVVVSLADSEGEGTVLVASVDERGAVVALEVRAVRQLWAWEGISDGKALARALRETGRIETIMTDPESGRVHLDLGKKRRFTVDPERVFSRGGDWAHEDDCGC